MSIKKLDAKLATMDEAAQLDYLEGKLFDFLVAHDDPMFSEDYPDTEEQWLHINKRLAFYSHVSNLRQRLKPAKRKADSAEEPVKEAKPDAAPAPAST